MEYKTIVELYERLESTSKRLEKTYYLSELLKKTNQNTNDKNEIDKILLLVQGTVFPSWMQKEIGIAARLILKTLSHAYGIPKNKIEQQWKKSGDLGLVSEEISKQKKQITLFQKKLTITKVFENIQKLATMEGQGSIDRKINLISELLTSATPKEAKYIVRTLLGDLRVGIGEGTIRDALVWAFFPKIGGVFYYCPECETFIPNSEKCIQCGNKQLIKKPEEMIKIIEKKKNKKDNQNKKDYDKKILIFDEKKINEFEGNREKKADIIYKILIEKGNEIEGVIIADDKLSREIYNKFIELLENAFNLTNDFSEIAEIISKKGIFGLTKVELTPGKPIKVMLFQKVKNIEEGFEAVGKPAAFEYKYDGFRLQIHKVPKEKIKKSELLMDIEKKTLIHDFNENENKTNQKIKNKNYIIKLFTRRLEDVSSQFPDVINYIDKNVKAKEFIIDCEVVGVDKKTGKFLPFQKISQRIKRKYEINELVKNVPVVVNVFDIIQYEGKSVITKPFLERRKLIEKIIKNEEYKIQIAKQIITDDSKKAETFYKESLKKGNEGVMIKSLNAEYKPGSRVGFGVKLKPVMETLDLVITGATYGEGKRSGWFSSFILSCKNKEGDIIEIGRVGTGIKEKEDSGGITFEQLTTMIKPLIISEDIEKKEVKIKPKIVLEINYEEIQKSPSYSSGYALRFPRVVRLREDRGIEDIATIEDIERLYYEQRGRHKIIQ